MFRRASPTGLTFVSYAYGDDGPAQALQQIELHAAVLEFFEPIQVQPSEMVSEKLISAIQTCDSLIYIDTVRSRESPWVTLESDYARRNGKPVFCFDVETGLLHMDDRPPLDLPVFPSYVRADSRSVGKIVRFMKNERSFDIFLDDDIQPGESFADSLQEGLSQRLERGGYVVAFWSSRAADSAFVKSEIESALRSHPDQVLVALLEETPPPDALFDRQAISLNLPGSTELDRRRVDGLIVRIYWLMQQHQQKNA